MSYTTRLLNIVPVRNRIILGVMIGGLTLSAIVDSVSSRPARSAHPSVVIVVATPTLPRSWSTGLAKEAAPMLVRTVPTATLPPIPTVKIATPAPQPIEVSQAVAQPEPTQRRVGERVSDKAGPPRRTP